MAAARGEVLSLGSLRYGQVSELQRDCFDAQQNLLVAKLCRRFRHDIADQNPANSALTGVLSAHAQKLRHVRRRKPRMLLKPW